MGTVNRRRFVQLGGLGAVALGVPGTVSAQSARDRTANAEDAHVRMSGDGLGLTPAQYARLLTQIAERSGIATDSYSVGGVVERLEAEFARLLGKEQAIFMPTGTLANHMAVRALAGGPSRVIVQEESHLYQDEGDCAQTLSGLTLVPLAAGRGTFSADDVQHVIDSTKGGRVVRRVSAISIETPIRRRQGERFDAAEMSRVVAVARREGIKLHLDGARLFLQAAYTSEDVAATARPFDTVYVSLYKYFNAPCGAILAGPRSLLKDMYHERRMFGGGLSSAWPFAAVALHFLDGFAGRYSEAVKVSEHFIRGLEQRGGFTVERVPSGTNLFRLRVPAADLTAFRTRLAASGILLPEPQRGSFVVGVNETWNRREAADLVDAFGRALA